MPRYFFHTHIGEDVIIDPDGRELADPDAAWEAAKTLALQLLQGADNDPELFKAVLFVSDDAEAIVLEFPLSEALLAEPSSQADESTVH